jgi:hypothetical protein
MRSSNDKQQAFGERLMDIVFSELPKRHASDPCLDHYFNDVLAEVAWAIRGFSVVRDIFQSESDACKRARDIEARHIESLARLAPFSSESIWGKMKGTLVGIGISAPLLGLSTKFFGASTPVVVISSMVIVTMSLVGMELIVNQYVSRRQSRLERNAPNDVMAAWQTKALTAYKDISRSFLYKVDAIHHRHFSGEDSTKLTGDEVEQMLTRAFPLESKKTTKPMNCQIRTGESKV